MAAAPADSYLCGGLPLRKLLEENGSSCDTFPARVAPLSQDGARGKSIAALRTGRRLSPSIDGGGGAARTTRRRRPRPRRATQCRRRLPPIPSATDSRLFRDSTQPDSGSKWEYCAARPIPGHPDRTYPSAVTEQSPVALPGLPHGSRSLVRRPSFGLTPRKS